MKKISVFDPLRRRLSLLPRTALALLAAAPVLAAILFSGLVLLILAIGGTSRWLDNDFNPAEAAVIGDVGRLYRSLEQGEPIDGKYPLRDSDPFERHMRKYGDLTPLDAAIVGDRVASLILLIERGAAGPSPDIEAIWCLARERNAHDIDRWYTRKAGGPENAPSCPFGAEK
jgi:hypothetical protein